MKYALGCMAGMSDLNPKLVEETGVPQGCLVSGLGVLEVGVTDFAKHPSSIYVSDGDEFGTVARQSEQPRRKTRVSWQLIMCLYVKTIISRSEFF